MITWPRSRHSDGMKRIARALLALAVAGAAVTGCTLYLGDGPEPDPGHRDGGAWPGPDGGPWTGDPDGGCACGGGEDAGPGGGGCDQDAGPWTGELDGGPWPEPDAGPWTGELDGGVGPGLDGGVWPGPDGGW